MSDVIPFKPELQDVDPDEMLKKLQGRFKGFVYCGITRDGKSEMFGSSYQDNAQSLWLLRRAEHFLVSADE